MMRLSRSHINLGNSLEVTTRYRLVVEGIRVAIQVTRTDFGDTAETRIDFWTPKTRWKTGKMETWKNPVAAFRAISSAIEGLYRDAAFAGDVLIIEAACERRLRVYARMMKRLLKEYPEAEYAGLDSELPGLIVWPYGR